MQELRAPNGFTFLMQGPKITGQPCPGFFYFALTKEESLQTPPYNTPIEYLSSHPIRLFSATLPGHGKGLDEHLAIKYWADSIEKGEYVLEEFLEQLVFGINWLIKERIVDENIAVGGLSRGGFIATHVAAKVKQCHTLLGYAPVTRFNHLDEFKTRSGSRFVERLESLNLEGLVDNLTHLKQVRFYMGNMDSRVGVDECYSFIRKLAKKAHEKHARGCHIELFLKPSIGHRGHGTSTDTFVEGAEFVRRALLP